MYRFRYLPRIRNIYIIFLLLVFILCYCLLFIQLLLNNTQTSSINSQSSISSIKEIELPDIFDLSLWRVIITGGYGNQTLCKVPDNYRSIVDAYCHTQNIEDCSEIPCSLIYLSKEFTENIGCLRGGKRAIGIDPDWICRKSPALELFSNPDRKPSIRAEASTPLTAELYSQALAPYDDEETSKWGLIFESQSRGYYSSIANKKLVLSLFDITLGYDRRFVDLITATHLTDYVDKITNKFNQRLTIRQVLRNKMKDQAPILWLNDDCDTSSSNRSIYMQELMRYIRVDVRGKCGNSKWNQSPKASVGKYLFTIAIENSLEYDYVTEKLWQPLADGSVPLYLGAPNIDEWLPCDNYSCIIHLRQFQSIRDVASFIHDLVQNKERYTAYHEWRNELNLRLSFISMVNYFEEANKHSIDCLICDMVYRHDHGTMRQKLLAANNPFNDTFPSLD